MKIKEKNAGKKSQGDRGKKKADGSPAEEGPNQKGEKGEELEDEAEVPPGGVEIEEIVVDPEKAESAQADAEAPVDRFETGLEGAEEVNEMGQPVHGIKAEEAVGYPSSPGDAPWFGGRANGGLG